MYIMIIIHLCTIVFQLYLNAGYWYVSTLLDRSVKSAMANSSMTRKAFMTGHELPPDDKVRIALLTVRFREKFHRS